jgi:hypothetical protein
MLGIDPGPSRFALVGDERAEIIPLADAERIAEGKLARKQRKRKERALQRSREASNPECYHRRRLKRGKRPKQLSKRGEGLQGKLQEVDRKAAEQRKHYGIRLAKELALRGRDIAIEKNSYKAWQASLFGKTIGMTAPGQFFTMLERELARVGSQCLFLDPWSHAFSQYCLCGDKVFKPMSVTEHVCHECGLGVDTPLDRNLFSALLIKLAGEWYAQYPDSKLDLSEAPFNTAGNRSTAARLCVVPRRAASAHDTIVRAPKGINASAVEVVRPSGKSGDAQIAREPVHQTSQPLVASGRTPEGLTVQPRRTFREAVTSSQIDKSFLRRASNKAAVIGEFKQSLETLGQPAEFQAEHQGILYLLSVPPIGDEFDILVVPDGAHEGKLFYFDEKQGRWRSRVVHEKYGVGSKRKIQAGEIEELISISSQLTWETSPEE